MPNNCGNTVIIIGPEHDIDLFVTEKLSFSYFIPPPESAEDDWYDENWGTKWEAYDVTLERNGPNGIEFNFSTAWGPPIRFLKGLLRKFPKCWVKLNYCEPMMMAAGVWIAYMKDGELRVKDLDWVEPLAMVTDSGEVICE